MRGPAPAPAPVSVSVSAMAAERAPWLAVIDMQRVFADPESPWSTPRLAEILPAVRELVAAYSPRVVRTRFVAPAEPAGAWAAYYEQWPFALRPPDDPIYDLVDGVAGTGPTIAATTFGKWTPEMAALVGNGPLVLAGVSTDCCVISTALAAADAGVEVHVVADACAGVDDASHAKALDVLRLYAPLIRVLNLAEAMEAPPADRTPTPPATAHHDSAQPNAAHPGAAQQRTAQHGAPQQRIAEQRIAQRGAARAGGA